jgi:hypothetical protein
MEKKIGLPASASGPGAFGSSAGEESLSLTAIFLAGDFNLRATFRQLINNDEITII